MKLAVRLYSDVPSDQKKAGIPNVWPAQTVELADDQEFDPPEGQVWQVMSKAAYDSLVATNLVAYRTWEASFFAIPNAMELIEKRQAELKKFSSSLIDEMAAAFVVGGHNQLQLLRFACDLRKPASYMKSGVVPGALYELSVFVPTAFATEVFLLPYVNRLRVYLGLAEVDALSKSADGF